MLEKRAERWSRHTQYYVSVYQEQMCIMPRYSDTFGDLGQGICAIALKRV